MLSQQNQEHNHTPTAWTGLLATLGQSYHSIKSRTARLCNHFIPQAAHIWTVYPLSKITYLSIALLYILMSLFMPFYSICSCPNCKAFFFKCNVCLNVHFHSILPSTKHIVTLYYLDICLFIPKTLDFSFSNAGFCISFGATFLFCSW